jgi:hypothetical protein
MADPLAQLRPNPLFGSGHTSLGGIMMLKKFTRRSATCFAIACLTFVVVSLWGPKEASTTSFFSGNQQWAISSDGWNIVAVYNFNTGVFTFTGWAFGSAPLNWTLPFGADKAFYLYDWNQGRWAESIYIKDYPY